MVFILASLIIEVPNLMKTTTLEEQALGYRERCREKFPHIMAGFGVPGWVQGFGSGSMQMSVWGFGLSLYEFPLKSSGWVFDV